MALTVEFILRISTRTCFWAYRMHKVCLLSSSRSIILLTLSLADTGGQNRFRIPQSLSETWSDVRPATSYGDACPDNEPDEDGVYGMSENCLSINIVRPANLSSTKLPVLFWIHGGSYQVGTSSLPNYNLTYIVERSVEIGKPLIGASINYRKGGWGNMYSIEIQGSGNANLALRDMRKALAWVQVCIRIVSIAVLLPLLKRCRRTFKPSEATQTR